MALLLVLSRCGHDGSRAELEEERDAGARATSREDARAPLDALAPDDLEPLPTGSQRQDAGRVLEAGAADASRWDPARPFEPQLAAHPYGAGSGFATQHGDLGASDTSPLSGPGAVAVDAATVDLLAVCPSVLPLKSGLSMAVCTQIANQTPAVFLLDPDTLTTLATRPLQKGDLFGGVYPYLDEQDRLLAVDGANDLLRIEAREGEDGFSLEVESKRALGPAVAEHCGSPTCDSVVGLSPDYQGRVWFVTSTGLAGTLDERGALRTMALHAGERVANSIATAPGVTAVVSDHALYLLEADAEGAPSLRLRAPYERGDARKPGQLSWGSGSTPTFFGPHTGSEYVALTDNARPTMNLVVHHSDGRPEPVCTFPVPGPAGDGSENSPIGAGRSVFVTSTHGYPYIALPSYAGASVPEAAPLRGGMARIDVSEDERACELVWTNGVRSAAVPKLSVADGKLYTLERTPPVPGSAAGLFDAYAYTVIDPHDGTVLRSQHLPGLTDPMQLAGTLGTRQTIFQGTITGLVRLRPAAARSLP